MIGRWGIGFVLAGCFPYNPLDRVEPSGDTAPETDTNTGGPIDTNTQDEPLEVIGITTVFTGASPGDLLGLGPAAMAAVGDFNGDKKVDLVFSAYSHGDKRGRLGTFPHGTRGGSLADAAVSKIGTELGERLGWSIAVGDIDGDGDDDLAVGAPGSVNEPADHSGTVYLLNGQDGAPIVTLQGVEDDDLAGSALAVVRDRNGDGLQELLVGAPGAGSDDSGGGYLFLSGASWGNIIAMSEASTALIGARSGEGLGRSVAAIDLDGDDSDELLIGSPSYRVESLLSGGVVGWKEVSSGEETSIRADFEWTGEIGAHLGDTQGIQAAGDIDGDGRTDVLVAARTDGNVEATGLVYLVNGGNTLATGRIETVAAAKLYGEASGDDAGISGMAAAGDVDGDGFDDVLVAATGHEPDGRAYLVHGPQQGQVQLADTFVFVGAPGAGLGQVASAGDQDGDGRPDLLLGAPFSELGAREGGAAYLIFASEL